MGMNTFEKINKYQSKTTTDKETVVTGMVCLSISSGEDYIPDPFNWDFIGKNLFCMAVEGFVYFILNILFQYRFFLNHW